MAAIATYPSQVKTGNPFVGRDALPMIERINHPGARLLEYLAVLDGLLRQGAPGDTPLIDLARQNKNRFSHFNDIERAIRVRNRHTHVERNTPPPKLRELDDAASRIHEGVMELLESATPEIRTSLTNDQHEPGASMELPEIEMLDAQAERVLHLDQRLNALLARIDREESRGGYDVDAVNGQSKPATLQRLQRHIKRFEPIRFMALVAACKFAASLRKEAVRTTDGLSDAEEALREGVKNLETSLGLRATEEPRIEPEPEPETAPEVGVSEEPEAAIEEESPVEYFYPAQVSTPQVSAAPGVSGGVRIMMTYSGARKVERGLWLLAILTLLSGVLVADYSRPSPTAVRQPVNVRILAEGAPPPSR